MQASSKTETLLDPSTSHLTGSFCVKDGTVRAHVLVTSRDCVGKESREEAQVSKSSWFQRLKPRVGMVTSEASRSEKERPPPETEVEAWSAQPDGGLSQAAGSTAHQSLQAEASSSTLKVRKTNKGKDASEAKSATGQEKLLLQDAGRTNKGKDASEGKSTTGREKLLLQDAGRRFANSAATEMGFGPWVNIGFGRRSETENAGTVPVNVIDMTTNGLELGKEAEGNPNCAVNISPKSLLGSTPGEATASVLCKPLSPKQSKLGLPPRPPGHKVIGFNLTGRTSFPAGRSSRGAFHQLTIPSRQSLAAPVLEIQDRDVGKHGEASFSRAGGSSKMIGGIISNALWHSKVSIDGPLSPTRTGNGGASCEQLSRLAVSERGTACIKPVQHVRACSDVPTGKLLEMDMQESAIRNVSSSSPVTGLQLKLVDSGAETMKNDSSLQVASLEISKSKLCQHVLEGVPQHGKGNGVEQVANAFTATSPWELFIEPAGALKIAREQFVEVYNRARDELKNQRSSQSSGRSLAKELDGGPKLTLGPSGATSNASIDGQTLKHGQQLSAPLQLQGKTTKLEEQSLLHQSRLKNQDALRTAVSSQGKQAKGFQRAHLVSERPLIDKGVIIPDGHADLSIRLPEGSFVNARDLRTSEHNVVSSNPFCNQNGLVSTSGQNMKRTGLVLGPGKSCNQNDAQEVASVLGKRTRVTFDDHEITLAAEKITASRPHTQSKPHLWLQRWHSAPKYGFNGFSAKTEVLPDGKGDSLYHQSSGLKKLGDEDRLGVFGHASSERVKVLKANSSKVVPSAAAMAIVGTAARHFCASQPEGKGSFAFWSGFGTQTYRRDESIQEEGKEKTCEKLNKDLHGC